MQSLQSNIFECIPRFNLLNPLTQCLSNSSPVFVGEYEDFEDLLEKWTNQQKSDGVITDAAVYFRDLSTGPWFGINERAEFIPASLFKLPLMMVILRASKEIPDLLNEQVMMSGAYLGINSVLNSDQTIKPNTYYSVSELLHKMIVYSDNASQHVLKQVVDHVYPNEDALRTTYQELGMLGAYKTEVLSVKTYAALLRILYNGRYLGNEKSQQALELLSKTIYNDGLVAGVPKNVRVAHKFGIYDMPQQQMKQFHDCGIVYYPHRPYMLCVMVRGKGTSNNIQYIADVSKLVYSAVDERIKAGQ